jgi:lipooligosaccharide transport system permease protein
VIAIALGRSTYLLERNLRVYRRIWMTIFSGFFEPLFYLFSMGIGLVHYVGPVDGVRYAAFVAPALLASAAMNGAIYDATNVFWKMRYGRVYDAVLATPLGPRDIAAGETVWALFRGLLYSAGFLVVVASLGLIRSAWGILALPAAALIGFGFAGVGIAAITYMRSWQDFELLTIAQLPMFLFSATFYPLTVYPDAIRWLVELTPLYRSISLMRALLLGGVGWMQLVDVLYVLALGLVGLRVAGRRIHRLLLS